MVLSFNIHAACAKVRCLGFSTNDKLLATFQTLRAAAGWSGWELTMWVRLNDAILAGRTKEVILISEALQRSSAR